MIPPKANHHFVYHMEDVLDLYHQPYDPANPVVCFDETSKQLTADVREPIAAVPGRQARYDYEYKRKGVANLFIFFEPLRGWRHLKVTEQRATVDWAMCMKQLVDEFYPRAQKIRLVLDNLSTHHPALLYRVFEPEEAKRLIARLDFHYTPKHGSWLNPVLSLPKGWQRLNSAPLQDNVWASVSLIRSDSNKKSQLGKSPGITTAPRSIGTLPLMMPASN